MKLVAIWVLLTGCYESSQHLQDIQLHQEAQNQSHPNQSILLCNQIQDESMRGECVWYTAQKAITLGVDPFPICDHAPNESWRGACIFEVADRNSVTGEQAQVWCKQAGDFYQRCMYHALQREESQLMQRYPLGKEQELIAEIKKRLSDVGEIKEDRLSETLPARILARRFMSKWAKNKNLLFTKEHCGNVTDEICTNVYRFTLKMSRRRPQHCVEPMDPLVIKKARMPMWDPSFETFALDAWEDFCRN